MVKVGFSTHRTNPLSWLIRTVTGSKVSHVWFLVDDPLFDMQMVIEASEVGFRVVPFDDFQRTNTVVDIFTPRYPLDAGFRIVAKNLGSRYDYLGLLGMAFVMVGRWFKRKLKNPLSSSKTLFCSEAISLAMANSAYPNWSEAADCTDPQELYAFFTKELS